ncbi:MAG: phospholipid carrier-dependent glycosyltransferase, partial [Clostridia bacterium]|nr:phospholipid carrier-dependent glycosyltransferase [Clostridia bacterium]
GGNWVSASQKILFLPFSTWGTLFILLSVAYTAFLYLKGRKNGHGSMMLAAAFLIAAVFTTGHYMHERYLFPALVFLLFAFIEYRDKRLYTAFAGLSIGMLLNVMAAFVIVDHPECRGAQYDVLTFIGSLITVVSFIYFAYAATDILVRKQVHPAFREEASPVEPLAPLEESESKGKLRFTKKDKLYCWILTAVYAVVALLNLGSLQAPETYWLSDGVGEKVEIRFEETVYVDDIRVFGGLTTGSVGITAGDAYSAVYNEENGSMYRWETVGGGFTTDSISLEVLSGKIWINEIAFFDEAGELISATVVTPAQQGREHGPENLCDEPDEVPSKASYLNGMYFDELYHARTAYEHLNGLEPYENSHPPLGKIFIMLGVAVFGMNAFGWRIVGTLFGIGMVPIMYHFGKRLFKRSEYALLTAVLFAFDFMHFTQTRIATIDVYGVFFIILMYYYMYQYYCMSFYEDGLKKTLKPLALAGVFFALGAASKWICFYAGAGLAVILFTSLVQRYLEYRKAADKVKFPFWKNAVRTLLWCCVFYLAVPAAVYLLSYLPYVFSEAAYDLEGIWGVQEFMFRYHSGLTATHPFESTWWQWPFTIRPIWYHWDGITEAGTASSISAFGNPAVWWVCSIGMIAFIVLLLRGRIRTHKGIFVILVGAAANLMPWMLVTRCTFIYHFFATVPFILLISVYLLSCLERRSPRLSWVKWAWMGLAVLLFALFYPVISGLEVSEGYLRAMEWFPSWIFIP